MFLGYAAFAILLSSLIWRAGWTSPATLFTLYFLAVMGASDALPVGIAAVGDEARGTVLLGLAGFALPELVAGKRPRSQRSGGRVSILADSNGPDDRTGRPPLRMYGWAAILVLLTLVGFLQGSHAGFGGLRLLDIRQASAQQALSQQSVGFAPLLVGLAPLVAALGVLGAVRYRRRYWLLLLVLAVAANLPTANKTSTLTVVFTSIIFYLLCRGPAAAPVGRRRARTVVIAALTLAASLVYFTTINAALNKDVGLGQDLSHSWLPAGLLGPATYELGGLSALSVAQSTNVDPRADRYGRSVYAIPWALRFVDDTFHKPQTIAYNVAIPILFNVYTGFGDIWFDFGWVGVFVISSIFGALVSVAYRRRHPSAYHWALVLALTGQLLASMTISFRLLYLESVMQLVIGYIAFRHIAAARVSRSRAGLAGRIEMVSQIETTRHSM